MITVKKPTNNLGINTDSRNFYSYSNDVLEFLTYIANEYLYCVKSKNVLEIGPATGWFTHALLEINPKSLTLVESFDPFFAELEHKFNNVNNITLLKDDIYHYLITKQPKFDIVVALGVIYHFTDPIGFLERIVNFCQPEYLVLDSPDGNLSIVSEPGDPGDRQISSDYKSSHLTITIPVEIQKEIMYNYGYELIKSENLSRFDIQSKEETIIMLFKKI